MQQNSIHRMCFVSLVTSSHMADVVMEGFLSEALSLLISIMHSVYYLDRAFVKRIVVVCTNQEYASIPIALSRRI